MSYAAQIRKRCKALSKKSLGLADNRVELLCAAVRVMAELFPQRSVEQVIGAQSPTKKTFCLAVRALWTYRPALTTGASIDDLIPPDDTELRRIVAEHQATGFASIWEPQRRRKHATA